VGLADLSDAELWARAADHDGDAFGRLFERHAAKVFNHCFRRTADWEVAEDLTSVVFLEAWKKRRQVRLSGESVLPWLLAVANNCLRNTQRSRRRYWRLLAKLPPSTDMASFEAEASERMDDVATMARLVSALGQLSRPDREIVSLCDCQRPLGIPHWRPMEFPRDGHENSPRTATEFPAPSAGQRHHPLARGGIDQADRFAFGDDDVGVVLEPVDQG
jgi:RNA polymerase sigma factor (sigma-70 family)